MTCTTKQLEAAMDQYIGGSEGRYQYPLNKRFVYSEGLRALANEAEAYWLIDMIALQAVPPYIAEWVANKVGIGIITLVINKDETASIGLSIDDDEPDIWKAKISYTNFPIGEWHIYLGVDEIDGKYVVVGYIPQEH